MEGLTLEQELELLNGIGMFLTSEHNVIKANQSVLHVNCVTYVSSKVHELKASQPDADEDKHEGDGEE